jgi:TPR repeat protein
MRLDNYWRYVADGAADVPRVEQRCEEGDADACEAATDIHWLGIGVPKSRAKAAYFDRRRCALDEEACPRGPMTTRDERSIADAEEWERKCQAKPSADSCGRAARGYLGSGLDPKHGSALLEQACDLHRDELSAIYDAEKARGKSPTRFVNRICARLGKILVLGVYGVPRDVWHGTALLRDECDKAPSGASCSYLGLVSELGLGGAPKNLGAALARYQPACTIHTYYEGVVAGHADPKARVEDYSSEPLACWRLAALSMQGRGVTEDPRVIGHLYTEACIGRLGRDSDVFGLACAPAAALSQRYGLEHPALIGDIFRSYPGPHPLDMAGKACLEGSVDGCRLVARIQHYADDHQLEFMMDE